METSRRIVAGVMQEADLEGVVSIERASFPKPWGLDLFVKELNNHNARCYVFRQQSALVGYLCFWVVMNEAHVQTIAVHPGHRGQGLGTEIMEFLEEQSLKEGANRIILEVARRNQRARGLYKKCGFSSIGFRKQYYVDQNDDALVMEKWVAMSENKTSSGSGI
jgi:ribosomal-protein-alanine N-acetyltransferase